jgi:hypothetical protein
MSIMSVSATVQPGPRDAIDTLMQFDLAFSALLIWVGRQVIFLKFGTSFELLSPRASGPAPADTSHGHFRDGAEARDTIGERLTRTQKQPRGGHL